MRAIRGLIVASISLFMSASPAAALGITHLADGSRSDEWLLLDQSFLEFDGRNCELFLYDAAPELLLPALEALELDADAGDLQGLLTLVWGRP